MTRNGWIVFDTDRHALLKICDRYPDEQPGGPILLFGSPATVFGSYEFARGAVRRTLTWNRSRPVGQRDPTFGQAFRIRRVEIIDG